MTDTTARRGSSTPRHHRRDLHPKFSSRDLRQYRSINIFSPPQCTQPGNKRPKQKQPQWGLKIETTANGTPVFYFYQQRFPYLYPCNSKNIVKYCLTNSALAFL